MARYTAQEIRDAVQKSICEDNIAEMLLQYADELEREKKYEYKADIVYESGFRGKEYFDDLDSAKSFVKSCYFVHGVKFSRRSIGEWEEVSSEG